MIGRTISHYEILEQIGDGGMGQIYKALDTKLQVHRALKFIHPHLVADEVFKHRFIQEAQAASSLDHPNICGIHQVDETPAGRPFICMTYYDGVTLSDRMKEAPLPAVEVFRIGIATAQGLMCAHQNGITHRDIKPSNIMITDDGYVKILDFGLAKLAGVAGVTKTGITLGTVRYMSPEQGSGKEADHRTDIWSLGLIMYELATGIFPFEGDFDPAMIYSILNTEPVPAHEINSDISESHSRVIARCLEKDPDQRYQSIAELIKDMGGTAREEGWDSSFGDLVLPISNHDFGSIPARRSRRRRIALAAGFLAIAVWAVFWWTSRPGPQYSTEMRLAVLPLQNKAHPSQEILAGGMWEVVCQALNHASGLHESMWVVPSRLVDYADIGEDSQARGAFGVNWIVTGAIQRFGGGEVLFLTLRDAETLMQTNTVMIPFDPVTSALADSLPGAVAELIGLNPELMADFPAYLPGSGPPAVHYLQGLGAIRADDFPAAISSLRKVTLAEPEFGMGWSDLGWAQWEESILTGDEKLAQEAVGNLERAVAASPGMWWPLCRLGEVHRRRGNTDRAVALFQAADELDPGNPVVCRGLARVFRTQKRLAEAEAILLTATERRPDYFEAPRLLAMNYYYTDEEEESLRLLDRVLVLAPEDLFSLNTKGVILHERGEFRLAREYFERSFALSPKCEPCSNIGLSLYFEDKFLEAASFFELANEICGNDDRKVWANWATSLYWAEGKHEDALAKFQRAIELGWAEMEQSPNDPALIGDMIEYHAMIGDEETTRRLIAKGEPLSAGNGLLLYQIGDAYELLGDRLAALRYLNQAMNNGLHVKRIMATRELADLITDPRFVRMIPAESGLDNAQADSVQ